MSDIEVTSNQPPAQKAENAEENKSASVGQTDENKEVSDASDESLDNETDEVDEAKDENGDEDGQDEDKKPKKTSGFKKRISKLNQRATAAEQERDYWRQVALKGQDSRQDAKQADEKPKAEAQGKPTADQFETYAEFTEALTDWKVEQKEKEREAKNQTQKATEAQAQAKSEFDAKLATFKAEHTDWDDVMETVEDVILKPHQIQALTASDMAPAVMYELAKNRELVEALSKMSYVDAVKVVGRIEDRIQAKTSEAKKENKQTKAPPPPSPIGSSKAAQKKTIFDKDLSQEEYEALRRAQMKAKRA